MPHFAVVVSVIAEQQAYMQLCADRKVEASGKQGAKALKLARVCFAKGLCSLRVVLFLCTNHSLLTVWFVCLCWAGDAGQFCVLLRMYSDTLFSGAAARVAGHRRGRASSG